MEKQNNDRNADISEIRAIISRWRTFLLNILEASIGHTDNYRYLRSRCLKAFGDSGLLGDLERSFCDGKERTNEAIRHTEKLYRRNR